MARHILWFESPSEALADPVRFLAYAMRDATHEDMQVIRRYVSDDDFREALDKAPRGIVDGRSWAYWNSKMGRDPVPPLFKRSPLQDSSKPSSYYSMISRLVLAEGVVAHGGVFVDIHCRLSQQPPVYVLINPGMTVPTLVPTDRILDQSRRAAGSKGRVTCGFGLWRVPRGASRRPDARLGDVRAGHKENAAQR